MKKIFIVMVLGLSLSADMCNVSLDRYLGLVNRAILAAEMGKEKDYERTLKKLDDTMLDIVQYCPKSISDSILKVKNKNND